MRSKVISLFVAGLIVFFGLIPEVHGQIGSIQGEVKDAQGNPMEGVVIRIEGMEVKRKYDVKTNKEGKFFHGGVSLQGVYRVIAEKKGYQSSYVEGVRAAFRGAADSEEGRGVVNFTLQEGESGKLAFELTDEERERMKQEAEEARKQQEKLAAIRQQLNDGLQFYNLGQYEQAIQSFKAGIEKDAEQPALWANMGNAYSKLKQYDQALEAYQKAVTFSPEDPVLHQNLGGIYSAMGDAEKAQGEYQKAATLGSTTDPKSAAVNYYNMGVTFINSGKGREAAEALQKAVEIDPSHAEAHYQLGLTLLSLNRIPESIEHLKKYLELRPDGQDAQVARDLIKTLGPQ